MQCLLEVVESGPLVVRFSLFNPATAKSAQLVPRTLVPIGLFVTLAVRDESGEELYKSERPKAHLKLHPDRAESYLSLEPGYSFGALLSVEEDELHLGPGHYKLSATYTNGVFKGPNDAPIGSLACTCEQDLAVS